MMESQTLSILHRADGKEAMIEDVDERLYGATNVVADDFGLVFTEVEIPGVPASEFGVGRRYFMRWERVAHVSWRPAAWEG